MDDSTYIDELNRAFGEFKAKVELIVDKGRGMSKARSEELLNKYISALCWNGGIPTEKLLIRHNLWDSSFKDGFYESNYGRIKAVLTNFMPRNGWRLEIEP